MLAKHRCRMQAPIKRDCEFIQQFVPQTKTPNAPNDSLAESSCDFSVVRHVSHLN